MLSLLIGAERSADELAGEFGITLADTWDQLRQLTVAGLLDEADEENIRGRRARRYHHRWDEEPPRSTGSAVETPLAMSTAFFVPEDKATATAAARAPSPDAAE
jgi:predicted ArsR family transcriptional regulator